MLKVSPNLTTFIYEISHVMLLSVYILYYVHYKHFYKHHNDNLSSTFVVFHTVLLNYVH